MWIHLHVVGVSIHHLRRKLSILSKTNANVQLIRNVVEAGMMYRKTPTFIIVNSNEDLIVCKLLFLKFFMKIFFFWICIKFYEIISIRYTFVCVVLNKYVKIKSSSLSSTWTVQLCKVKSGKSNENDENFLFISKYI